MAFTCEFSSAFSTAFAICPSGGETPRQVAGGEGGGFKNPRLRPDFDHLAELRVGETGNTIRIIRGAGRSIEETTRQAVPVG